MAEVDGKRELPVGHTWGLCLSKPEVRRYVIDRTLDYARKHPSIGTIWIGQNDGSQPCTCKECQAFYDAHGGEPSALIVQLVNELADAIAKEMPDRLVKTLAYAWSLTPPEGMRLRDNVVMMFCASGNFFNPIETDPVSLGRFLAGIHGAGSVRPVDEDVVRANARWRAPQPLRSTHQTLHDRTRGGGAQGAPQDRAVGAGSGQDG
jgi:hypothetical protein